MFLLCLGVAAPLLAIGSFSLFKEYRTLKMEAQRATTLQAATGARTLTNWIEGELASLQAVAALTGRNMQGDSEIKSTLSTAIVSQPSWRKLYLVSADGNILTSVSANSKDKSNAGSRGDSRSLIASVNQEARAKMASSTVFDSTGKCYLLASAPIREGGKVKAQLLALIDPDAILDLFTGLSGAQDKSSGVIAVIDTNKRVIARTIENERWQGKDFSNAKTVRASEGKVRGTLEAVGIADPTQRAYAFDHEPTTSWLVVVGLPTRLIYGTAHDWLILMICLAACAISVSIMLAYSSTSYFTRAINTLVREALALGRGDFSKRANIKSSDELGLLARAFNEMASMLEVDRDHKNMVKTISESIRQSLDLDEILNTTVKELGENLSASRCCLALIDDHCNIDPGDDELYFDYMWCKPDCTPLNKKRIRVGEDTVLRKIVDQGEILWLDLLGKNQGELFYGHEESDWTSIKSMIACPITTGKTIGLILIHQCDHLRSWSQSELELVSAVASQVALAIEHGKLYSRARTLAEQEALINQIVKSVRASLDVDTILDTVTRELSVALGADKVHIAQPRAEGPLVVTHEHHKQNLSSNKGLSLYGESLDFHPNAKSQSVLTETGNFVLGIDLSKVRASLKEGSQSKCDLSDCLSVIDSAVFDWRCEVFRDYLDEVGSRSLIAAPLLSESQLVGVLIVHQVDVERTWTESEIKLVGAIADQLSIAITHAQLFAQVRHQAITDGLTGLYNHVYFKNRLSEELRMAERKNTPVSLIMIDLDKLKTINDTHGHPVGDAAIRQIAAILKTLLRSGDTAARYGGEEFGIILPETSLLEAALIADRLCSQIRNTPVPGLGKITASLGTATYPKQARSSSELIEKADKALYVAKNTGRDQVKVYEEELTSSTTMTAPTFTNVTRELERPKTGEQ